MKEWMGEWRSEWMDGGMNGWMKEWMDEWRSEWVDEGVNGWMEEWMGEWRNEWMGGWMDLTWRLERPHGNRGMKGNDCLWSPWRMTVVVFVLCCSQSVDRLWRHRHLDRHRRRHHHRRRQDHYHHRRHEPTQLRQCLPVASISWRWKEAVQWKFDLFLPRRRELSVGGGARDGEGRGGLEWVGSFMSKQHGWVARMSGASVGTSFSGMNERTTKSDGWFVMKVKWRKIEWRLEKGCRNWMIPCQRRR